MLWVAAFLALIIWVLGLASDFLGFRIHLFLLFAIFCALIAMLPSRASADDDAENEADDRSPDDHNAKSVPAAGTEPATAEVDPPTSEQATRLAVPDSRDVPTRSGQ